MPTMTIAANELSRVFLSSRGWLSLFAFALIWILFLVYVINPAAKYISADDTGGLLLVLFEQFNFRAMRNWDTVELALYWVFSLYLLPFFAIITAADQIASDKNRGTLRFLVLRTTRTEIFLGRFIGQCILQLLLVLVTVASVLALVAVNSPDRLSVAINESVIVIVNIWLVLLPYVALMSLMSVLAKTSKQATLYAIIGWILLWFILGYVQSRFGPIPLLDWVLPGSQLSSLVKLGGWDTISLAPIALVHAFILVVLGWVAMQRSDL